MTSINLVNYLVTHSIIKMNQATNVKLTKYHRYKNLVNQLIFISGISPDLEKIFPFYRIIAYFGIFLCGTCAIKIFGYCIDNISNVTIFASAMGNAFSFTVTITKIVSFLFYRKELIILNDKLGQKYERQLKKFENQSILLDRITIYIRFMYIIAVLTAAALIFYITIPLIYIIKYKKFIQIYLGRYPFPVPPDSPIYWTIISGEILSIVITWTVVTSVDNGFGLHCFRICGLLRLLSRRFRKLKPFDPNYQKELQKCIKFHLMLIGAKTALQKVYGFIVLYTFVTSAFIMCSIMYQANQARGTMTVMKIIFFASYITLKLLQSFTYAYYGSLVSQESEKCKYAIYTTNWAGSKDLRLMKDLLIIHNQKPMVLKANGFFIISMKMFEKIVHTTISYFFLLLTVEKNNY